MPPQSMPYYMQKIACYYRANNDSSRSCLGAAKDSQDSTAVTQRKQDLVVSAGGISIVYWGTVRQKSYFAMAEWTGGHRDYPVWALMKSLIFLGSPNFKVCGI